MEHGQGHRLCRFMASNARGRKEGPRVTSLFSIRASSPSLTNQMDAPKNLLRPYRPLTAFSRWLSAAFSGPSLSPQASLQRPKPFTKSWDSCGVAMPPSRRRVQVVAAAPDRSCAPVDLGRGCRVPGGWSTQQRTHDHLVDPEFSVGLDGLVAGFGSVGDVRVPFSRKARPSLSSCLQDAAVDAFYRMHLEGRDVASAAQAMLDIYKDCTGMRVSVAGA